MNQLIGQLDGLNDDSASIISNEVQNLLGIMSIRLLLIEMGITRLDVDRKSLVMTFSQEKKIDTEKLVQLLDKKAGKFRFLSQYKLKIEIDRLSSPEDFREIEKALQSIPVS